MTLKCEVEINIYIWIYKLKAGIYAMGNMYGFKKNQ